MVDMRGYLVLVVALAACDSRGESTTRAPDAAPGAAPSATAATVAPAAAPADTSVSAATASPPSTTSAGAPVVATSDGAGVALDPGRGKDIGMVFEAWLSPHQESDEEENTPKSTPKMFRSSTPSQSRAAREAAGHRGHGQVRFSKDLSRAFVDVKLEGVDPRTINMFHIHCGKPGILGPILVDFANATDLQSDLADGVLSVEIRNEHIVKTVEHAHGLIGAFTAGCIIPSPSLGSIKPSKVSTVAGMLQLALERELYFNVHTTGQTFFGDMRGQIHPAAHDR